MSVTEGIACYCKDSIQQDGAYHEHFENAAWTKGTIVLRHRICHKKAYRALVLAVSLWMMGSGHAADAAVRIEDGAVKGLTGQMADTNKLATSVVDGKSLYLRILDNVECGNTWIYAGNAGTDYSGWSTHLTGQGKDNLAPQFMWSDKVRICGAQFNGSNPITGNSVVISKVGLNSQGYEIFGGRRESSNSNITSQNVVEILDSSLNANGNKLMLYGGYAGWGNSGGIASGNTITVARTDFILLSNTSDIGGAYANNGTSDDNTVNLYDAVTGLGGVNVIGRLNGAVGTGNELHLGGTRTPVFDSSGNVASWNYTGETPWSGGTGSGNKVNDVLNFDRIVLHKVNWNSDMPALAAREFKYWDVTAHAKDNTKTTLDISQMEFAGVDRPSGEMALLQSDTVNDFDGLRLTYKNGTGTTTVALSQAPVTVKDIDDTISPAAGITFAYNMKHTVNLADSNKKILYTAANTVNNITLGTVTWGATPYCDAQNLGFVFTGNAAIDATNLKFTNPEAVAGETELLANAAGITGTIEKPSHSQAFVQTASNGAELSATLSGTVSKTSDTVKYTSIGTTLDSADLAGWDAATSASLSAWTPTTGGVAVTAAGFTEPTLAAGESTDIFTTDTANFFGVVSGAKAYTEAAFTNDTVNGVTLSGSHFGGVKATNGNKDLTYFAETMDVEKISFDEMAWGKSRVVGPLCNFANAAADAENLSFANPETIAANTPTTLLQANLSLQDFDARTKDISYEQYSPIAGVTIDGKVSGSYAATGGSIVYTAAENRATKLAFGEVDWKEDGALMNRPAQITFAGAAVDTSNITFSNVCKLDAGQEMTLVSDFGAEIGAVSGGIYKVGTSRQGKGHASLDDEQNLVFIVDTGSDGEIAQEQAHHTVMAEEVGMTALTLGSEFIVAAEDGLALEANRGSDGVVVFARMGGESLRQETGSHIKTHFWNSILAVGVKNATKRGALTYGAFFEYGTGSYSTYHADERGDGRLRYTGGGFLAKWRASGGTYVEGSLRAGSVHDDARNVLRDNDTGSPYSYDTDASYFGAHLGVGREIEFSGGNTLDVYGKYFFNRRDGVAFYVDAVGDHFDLDAVTSQVLRVGARYTMKREKWSFYGGLAYEYEFDGKARGMAENGGVSTVIRAADIGGGSARVEIGATMTPDKNSPWTLDFNISGFAGKKQGFSGGVSVGWMF